MKSIKLSSLRSGFTLALLIIIIVGASLYFDNRHLDKRLEATGQEVDIRGNWQSDTMQSCSGGKFLNIADDQISIVVDKAKPIPADVAIVKSPEATGPILILHPSNEPFAVEMLLHTDIAGGKLTFVAAEWSESAMTASGYLSKRPDNPSILSALQGLQPYHRCP